MPTLMPFMIPLTMGLSLDGGKRNAMTAAANAAVGSLKEIKTVNGANRPVDPAVANLVSSILTVRLPNLSL